MNIKTYGFDSVAEEAAYKAEGEYLLSKNFTSFDRVDSASLEKGDDGAVVLIANANMENSGSGTCEFAVRLQELPRERILWYEKVRLAV